MKILRAQHLGMCFGVRDAIALAVQTADREPLTILGDLVHNETVLSDLRRRGIELERHPQAVTTPTVMITAHGSSERRLEQLRSSGRRILEATCPLVRVAHDAVNNLVREGYHPVIVGLRDHVEVRGLTEDLLEFDVILTAEDVHRLPEKTRFGLASQTTQPIDRVWHLADLLRHRFPRSEVRVVDTVCRPTKLRQWSAESLASECDVVVVVGGRHSNNTRELAETCRRLGARVHHVQCAEHLRKEWLAGASTVGLTAGTSTPDEVVDSVEERLRALAEEHALAQSAREPVLQP